EDDPGVERLSVHRSGKRADVGVIDADNEPSLIRAHSMTLRDEQLLQKNLIVVILWDDRKPGDDAVEQCPGRSLVQRSAGVDQHQPITDLLELAEVVR